MAKLVLSKISLAELREVIHLHEGRVAPYSWTQVESIPLSDHELIGVNATLRDHITIAKNCVIGAGALILHDTQENGVYKSRETELSKVPSQRLKGL